MASGVRTGSAVPHVVPHAQLPIHLSRSRMQMHHIRGHPEKIEPRVERKPGHRATGGSAHTSCIADAATDLASTVYLSKTWRGPRGIRKEDEYTPHAGYRVRCCSSRLHSSAGSWTTLERSSDVRQWSPLARDSKRSSWTTPRGRFHGVAAPRRCGCRRCIRMALIHHLRPRIQPFRPALSRLRARLRQLCLRLPRVRT